MKYVKLNNNRIYDVRHLEIDGPLKDGLTTEWFVGYSGKRYGTSMNGVISIKHLCDVSDIVEESDDLEDLFDEKVLVVDGQKPVITNIANLDEFENGSFSNAKYYGAVWTDGGLSYFAEFKNGEWEIL